MTVNEVLLEIRHWRNERTIVRHKLVDRNGSIFIRWKIKRIGCCLADSGNTACKCIHKSMLANICNLLVTPYWPVCDFAVLWSKSKPAGYRQCQRWRWPRSRQFAGRRVLTVWSPHQRLLLIRSRLRCYANVHCYWNDTCQQWLPQRSVMWCRKPSRERYSQWTRAFMAIDVKEKITQQH